MTAPVLPLPVGSRQRRAFAILRRPHGIEGALALIGVLERADRESSNALAFTTLLQAGYTAQNAADLLEQLGYAPRAEAARRRR